MPLEVEKLLAADEKQLLDDIVRILIKKNPKATSWDFSVNLANKEKVPCSIFSLKLGILEAIVKYLHENRGMKLSEIALLLKRTKSYVSVTYWKATRKVAGKFKTYSGCLMIPIEIFTSELTCFESLCLYLKDTLHLRYHDIAVLLKRDDRTVWTIYNRAKAKGRKRK